MRIYVVTVRTLDRPYLWTEEVVQQDRDPRGWLLGLAFDHSEIHFQTTASEQFGLCRFQCRQSPTQIL